MTVAPNRRTMAVLIAGLLAAASLAAADVASLTVEADFPALVRVSGPAVETTVDLGAGESETLSLAAGGTHHVEHLASTIVPSCDTAVAETSGLVIEADGTASPLGAAATIDVAPGDETTCTLGG